MIFLSLFRRHLFAVCLCLPGALLGQDTALIANAGARRTINLDGQWQVIVDPYDVGFLDYRDRPLTNNSAFFKNYKPQSPSELVEHDFDSSGHLNVPGDWNTQREALLFYEGSVWYKRSFDFAKAQRERVFVHFGAANYKAFVYMNGEEVGRHEGGFTPFDFEITNQVREKDNFLVVRVDDSRKSNQVPSSNSDWWNYGGITRSVALIIVPESFIQDYSIQLAKGSRQQITGWIRLNGAQLQQSVSVKIPEAKIEKTFQTDTHGQAEFSFNADLQLWSTENPKLYGVEIAADTDKVADRIGFRSIEVRGSDILLNGKSVFLRGISLHEEAPTHPGRSWSEEDAQTLLTWAKALGCNFVRLAHYPYSETMLRSADQMGFLVWEEVPVYWNIEWENPETLRSAETQLKEMIARDHNRASVIIYSVGNETPVSEPRNSFLRQLIGDARSADGTRLVSAALQPKISTQTDRISVQIDDPVAGDLDVVGINEYIGWYFGRPEDADKADWTSKFAKPLIVTEFGGDALFGYHGDMRTRWTEEYQENLYEHQIAMLKRISFLRGVSPWALKDFRSPRRTLPRFEDYFNRKGLVSERGEKKRAFFVLQKFYQAVPAAPQTQ